MPLILVIDDDRIIATLIEASLSLLEYDVVTAHDAAAGLKLAASMRPDAIITDKNMPDTSGLELLKLLRQTPFTADIPIMMLTAEEVDCEQTAAQAVGATDYMTKPFDVNRFLTRVTHMISGAGGQLTQNAL